VFHYACGDGTAVFPHTLVIAEDNAKITVADFFRTGSDASPAPRAFACGGNDLYAGHGASVTYVAMQDWSRETLSFQFNATPPAATPRCSRSTSTSAAARRGTSRTAACSPPARTARCSPSPSPTARRSSTSARCRATRRPHTSPTCSTKTSSSTRRKTIFSGLIVVDPDAQKTDAYQSNRNLMLSDDAEAQQPARPRDPGQRRPLHPRRHHRPHRPEQQFYLESRGIKPAQAHELLVFGFFEEVLSKLADGICTTPSLDSSRPSSNSNL
jgi:Fe-S cluster assembly protein SufD